ncbi:DUF4254 domain-containing protein [Novipirellula artificiosorum]|uniref:DUF4254 domain-containing protein n=1 Tax=Novipirellula artificiosorum TaxID=2528016 RepID=A0A5C6D9I6_9BACT|nr:DUF4254 domain-containing protein [Novipirellula artificiosorum]TWU32825.1 hypothetical protein Poly41_52020 [Novipirellula artificiosorum]
MEKSPIGVAPIVVEHLTRLQTEAVERWHREPIDDPYSGFESLVCQQHQQNFRLWHAEDEARDRLATDRQLAKVKRSIDGLNQARNDLIEKLDDAITAMLHEGGVSVDEQASINTETPGSVIDRLSIMSLRRFHYREQLDRDDVDADHRQTVTNRVTLCEQQHHDLAHSLQELLDDLFAGRKRHKTYRQMKMYNDPSLNPAIYRSRQAGSLDVRRL